MYEDLSHWAGHSACCLGQRFASGFVYHTSQDVQRAEQHEGLCVTWIIRGSGHFALGDEKIPLREESSCLRSPDQSYVMQLDPQVQHARFFLLLPQTTYPLLLDLYPQFDELPPVHQVPYDPELVQTLWQFVSDMRRTPDIHAHALFSRAFDIVLRLSPIATRLGEAADAMNLACALLSDPDNIAMPLPDIAKSLGLSYHIFRKQFSGRFGVSPGQYRLHKRMEYAKQALSWGDSIQSVSKRLGFSDVYAFSKQFRSMTGVTPGYFRTHHLI